MKETFARFQIPSLARLVTLPCKCKCHGRVPHPHSQAPQLRAPHYKALLIGIGYGKVPKEEGLKLDGCIGDARKMKDMLIRLQDFQEHDITLMTDETGVLEPTRENIIHQMQKLVSDAGCGDVFVFYYAGHSSQLPAVEDKFEVDGKDEYILCSDLEIILDDEIRKLLVMPLEDTGARLTGITDACHSGTVFDLDHYSSTQLLVVRQHSHPNLDRFHKLTDSFSWPSPRRVISLPNMVGRFAKCTKVVLDDTWRIAKAIARLRYRAKSTRKADHDVPEKEENATLHSPSTSMSTLTPTTRSSAWASRRKCCRAHPTTGGALVISVSACLDHQEAIEDSKLKKAFFTEALLQLLEEDRGITVGALEKKLRAKMSEAAFEQLHIKISTYLSTKQKGRMTKKKAAKKEEKRRVPQQPEIGSMHHLCAEEQFLVRREDPAA